MTAIELARENVDRAYDLFGKLESAWELENVSRNAALLAERYGVVDQFNLLASQLIAEKNAEDLSKAAAFWTARRLYSTHDDGGMTVAAQELELENAVRGTAIDAETAELVARLRGPAPVVAAPADEEEDIHEPTPLGDLIDRDEDFIRAEYKRFYSTGERKLFMAHYNLAIEDGHPKLASLQYAHTVVIRQRIQRGGGR